MVVHCVEVAFVPLFAGVPGGLPIRTQDRSVLAQDPVDPFSLPLQPRQLLDGVPDSQMNVLAPLKAKPTISDETRLKKGGVLWFQIVEVQDASLVVEPSAAFLLRLGC